MTLSPSRIVRVTETAAPQVVADRGFDKVLFVTDTQTTASADNIDAMIVESGVRSYANLDAVETDWGAGTSPRAAAGIWFQQVPYPGAFAVIPHVAAGREGIAVGATATGTRAEIQALTSFTFGGADVTVDLSSAASPSDVATAVATGINAISGLTGVVVSAGGSDALPATGASSINLTVTVPVAATAVSGLDVRQGFAGSDAAALGLVAGARYAPPIPASADIGETLTRAQSIDDTFYWITLSNSLSTDVNVTSASAWAQTRRYIFGFDTDDASVLLAGDASSLPAQLNALNRTRTFCFWSRDMDYQSVSACARMSSIDFDAADSLITLAHKALPGVPGDTQLTDDQADELDRKSVNYYAPIAGASRVFLGYTLGGIADDDHEWIDRRVWVDWLVSSIQRAVLNLLSAARRVPLTQRGSVRLRAVVDAVCQQGVLNGGFAPGNAPEAVSANIRSVTGNASFDGYMPAGFRTHIGSQSQADSTQRTAPPLKIWGLYGSAINNAAIEVTLNS